MRSFRQVRESGDQASAILTATEQIIPSTKGLDRLKKSQKYENKYDKGNLNNMATNCESYK